MQQVNDIVLRAFKQVQVSIFSSLLVGNGVSLTYRNTSIGYLTLIAKVRYGAMDNRKGLA